MLHMAKYLKSNITATLVVVVVVVAVVVVVIILVIKTVAVVCEVSEILHGTSHYQWYRYRYFT